MRTVDVTHVDGGVGRDAEESGALVDGLQALSGVAGPPGVVQVAEGALQRRPVLPDQLVAGAQVVQLDGQSLQHAGGQRSAVLR